MCDSSICDLLKRVLSVSTPLFYSCLAPCYLEAVFFFCGCEEPLIEEFTGVLLSFRGFNMTIMARSMTAGRHSTEYLSAHI